MTTRQTVTVPAAGVASPLNVAGRAVIIETGEYTEPADVPTLHRDTPEGDELPAYPQAKYVGEFERLFVRGTTASAGSTLYLLVVSGDVDVTIPNTPTYPPAA